MGSAHPTITGNSLRGMVGSAHPTITNPKPLYISAFELIAPGCSYASIRPNWGVSDVLHNPNSGHI